MTAPTNAQLAKRLLALGEDLDAMDCVDSAETVRLAAQRLEATEVSEAVQEIAIKQRVIDDASAVLVYLHEENNRLNAELNKIMNDAAAGRDIEPEVQALLKTNCEIANERDRFRSALEDFLDPFVDNFEASRKARAALRAAAAARE
jgi:hypothetical protein